MTFVSVAPDMVRQDLDLNWSPYSGIWGAQASNKVHNTPSIVLHEFYGGQYTFPKKKRKVFRLSDSRTPGSGSAQATINMGQH